MLVTMVFSRSSATLRIVASKVRTVPRISTLSGMTFHASDSVRSEVTDTTTDSKGSMLRATMVCSVITVWLAITVVSIVRCG